MHPHSAFHIEDSSRPEMLLAHIGFGSVFTQTLKGPHVAHTPLVPLGDGLVQFQLSNRNALTSGLDGATALLLVNGPGACVSPRRYEDRGQVPTWNYVALEMEGCMCKLAPEALADLLGAVGAREEGRLGGEDRGRPEPVPANRWGKLFGQITGFELEVQDFRPIHKLGRNKPDEDRRRVADALEAEGLPAIAYFMRGLAQ